MHIFNLRLFDWSDPEKLKVYWFNVAFVSVPFLVIGSYFLPELYPYGLFNLLLPQGNYRDWLLAAAPVLLWGTGATAWACSRVSGTGEFGFEAERALGKGILISLRAGILEEICFRWILFLGFIPVLYFVNQFSLWAFQIEAPKALFYQFYAPLADSFTLGFLHHQLTGNWLIAASMLSVNFRFQDEHAYLGWVGYINSWFFGMYMFYMLFHFGLLACVLAHILYDLGIVVVLYLDKWVQRLRRL
jgi:hypothetical protein